MCGQQSVGSGLMKWGQSMEDCHSDMRGCMKDCNGSGCGLCMCRRNSMIVNDTSFGLMPYH